MQKNFEDLLSSIKLILAKDLAAVDQIIATALNSFSRFSQDRKIYSSLQTMLGSGKRLRPILLLLVAKILAPYADHQATKHIRVLAAVVELIHIASLLHDDVLDHAASRRKQLSINAAYGNKFAILSGDLLYTQAFSLITALDLNFATLQQITLSIKTTVNSMIEGELLQLLAQGNIFVLEERYLEIITAKTAELFKLSMSLPSLLGTVDGDQSNSPRSPELQSIWQIAGLHLGIAYQLLDDLLDYADQHKDLEEGKVTLPVIYVLNNANITKNHKIKMIKLLKQQIKYRSNRKTNCLQPSNLQELNNIILQYNGFAHTLDLVNQHLNTAKAALAELADNPYTAALNNLLVAFGA